jgi:DNA polymerase III subunit beta
MFCSQFDRKQLLTAMSTVAAVSARDKTSPIYDCLMLSYSDNVVKIYGTDGDMSFEQLFERDNTDERQLSTGQILLPSKAVAMVRDLPTAEKVTIELTKTGESEGIAISGDYGKFDLSLPGQPEQMPVFGVPDHYPDPVTIEGVKLKQAIALTAFATTESSARHAISGVLIEVNATEGAINFVATDGHRLSFYSIMDEVKTNASHIIPVKALQLLSKTIQDNEEVKIFFLTNGVMFQTSTATIYTGVIEGRFPNYRLILPDKAEKKFTVFAGSLLTALKAAAHGTDDESVWVEMDFHSNLLKISSMSPTRKSFVNLNFFGEVKNFKIRFNPKLVMDYLKHILPDEEITFEMTTSARPIKMSHYDRYTYIVMPIELPEEPKKERKKNATKTAIPEECTA